MDSVAFRLGSLTIHWYGIFIATAVLLGFFLARRLGRRFGMDLSHFEEYLLYAVPIAVVGARLWYVLFNLERYLADPVTIFYVWQGGLAIHGLVLACVAFAVFYCRWRGISFWRFTDAASPALLLGQAIGRWGNYANQEAYGRLTDLPWAMYIAGGYRHPTFLYEFFWNLMIVALMLFFVFRRKPLPGQVFALYLAGYSTGRLWIEALRTDSLMLGPFRVAQLVSIAMIIAGIALYLRARKTREPEQAKGGDTGESA